MRPVLKYPGAKWSMAEWITSHIPPHKTYLEPYFGSGAVLFNKAPSPIETINDLDDNVTNLFSIIRDNPKYLSRLVAATPYSRREYDLTFEGFEPVDNFEKARRFLI